MMGKEQFDALELEHRLTVLEQQSKTTSEGVTKILTMLEPIQNHIAEFATFKTWLFRIAIGAPVAGGTGILAWFHRHFNP